MELYKNKYRAESNRLSSWDYSSAGYYFITICTQNRICYFGDITSLQGSQSLANLSPIGEIAHKYWEEIPKHFDNIDIDQFIIMPNHVHGIIIINATSVETHHGVSLPQTNKFGGSIPNSLPTVIKQYKSSVTRWCNQNDLSFTWQRNYHEHIIRDEEELNRIREYIINNPINWNEDENFI
jgi:REP element-mobilizing transposase RayT